MELEMGFWSMGSWVGGVGHWVQDGLCTGYERALELGGGIQFDNAMDDRNARRSIDCTIR